MPASVMQRWARRQRSGPARIPGAADPRDCAIGAFEQIIHDVDEVPNLFFDTSWWNPADVWALFRMVAPGRILYASDMPFGTPAASLVLTGRLSIQAGLSPEQIRGVMGGQLERLVAHAEPLELGPVPDEVGPLATGTRAAPRDAAYCRRADVAR